MARSLGKMGGTNGEGYFDPQSDGSVNVSDGTTVATLTRAAFTALASLATYTSGLILDYTGISTGTAYVSLKANLASAWAVKQGATALVDFVTTTGKSRVKHGVPVTIKSQALTISADNTLVFGTAGANQTALVANVLFVTNSGGATKKLILPALSDLVDYPLFISVGGGNSVDVKLADGTTTVTTIASGKVSMIQTDGTNAMTFAGA